MTDTQQTPTLGVPVQLADRVRHLRYSFRTLREMQTDEQAKENNLLRYLWFGLRHEDPDLTMEMIEDLCDLQGYEDLRRAVNLATGGIVALPPLVDVQAAAEASLNPTTAPLLVAESAEPGE
jgi:hypothetical protein